MQCTATQYISRLAAAALAFSALASGGAHAALVGRVGGMVYDTDRNLTWMANANLLGTLRAADPTLIASIVAAVPMVTAAGQTHTVTAAEFAPLNTGNNAGTATWWGATAFARSLSYGGFSDWRLPVSLQPDAACSGQNAISNISFGTGCIGSELGHLFYAELGGMANQDLALVNNGSFALFSGFQNDSWTGTTFRSGGTTPAAWLFDRYGVQSSLGIGGSTSPFSSIWLVRDGDVTTAVPEPATLALLLAGLGALGANRMRRRAD